MSTNKPVAFFLLGSFGIGKTSIVAYKPHKQLDEVFSEVKGLVSPGGERGTDNLNGWGINKIKFYTEFLPKYQSKSFLFHGVFYSSKTDFYYMARTHKVVGIWLDTDPKIVAERMAMREGKFNMRTFNTVNNRKLKLREFFGFLKSPFYIVNNNRDLETVASEVWGIINKEK